MWRGGILDRINRIFQNYFFDECWLAKKVVFLDAEAVAVGGGGFFHDAGELAGEVALVIESAFG